jgi:hypothetical protein
MVRLVHGMKLWVPSRGLLGVLNVDYLKKIITRMEKNCEANPLSLINLSLEIGYCNTTLSNLDIIMLVRLVSKIKVGVVEWVLSLIYI